MDQADFVEAAFRGDLKVVEDAIREGLPLNGEGSLIDIRGHRRQEKWQMTATPLIAAVARKESNRRAIERLVEAGASPNVGVDGDVRYSPISWALFLDAYEHAHLLLDLTDSPFQFGCNLLSCVKTRRLMRRLINANPPQECLDAALRSSHVGANQRVKSLLAAGANMFSRDDWGGHPLHFARSAELIHALIDHGADLEATTEYGDPMSQEWESYRVGWTPLGVHVGSEYWVDHDSVVALVSRGCNVNFIHESGISILLNALSGGAIEASTLDVLLKAGADLSNKSFGTEPIHCYRGNWSAARGIEVLQVLLKAGVRVDARSQTGWTALHAAVDGGELDTERDLLAVGADINARVEGPKRDGCTPLMLSASRPDLVPLLLDAGANPLLTCRAGNTALAYIEDELFRANNPGPRENDESEWEVLIDADLLRAFGASDEEIESYVPPDPPQKYSEVLENARDLIRQAEMVWRD